MDKKLIVIDLEASGLNTSSFPISVAWGDKLGSIEHHIIRPFDAWLYDEASWDKAAVNVHGITLDYLLDNGESAHFVASRLACSLNNRTVYSDNPSQDVVWLDKLHDECGVKRSYTVWDIGECLPKIYDRKNNYEAYMALKSHAFARSGAKLHTADGDVLGLLAMIDIAGR